MGPTTRGGSSTKKYYTVEGSSKRPREGDMIDLVEEEDDMRKRIMELEEENRRLKEVEIVQKEEDDMSKRITFPQGKIKSAVESVRNKAKRQYSFCVWV